MALPGAAQSERNPARGALAGDGAGSADDCGGVCSLDGAGARLCVFALAVLATDGLPGACGGSDVAGTLPVTVDNRFSSGGARRGYRVAGADFVVRDGAARTILSVLCVRDGGGSVSLGSVGDGGRGGRCVGAAGDGSLCVASRTGTGGGSVAASGASAASGYERAGTGSTTAVHDFGVSDCARIFAGLHGGEPEESSGGASRDHARPQFDAGGGGTYRDHAADSWGGDKHLRREPGAERFSGSKQLPGISGRGDSWCRGQRSATLARGFAGKRKGVPVRIAGGCDLRVAHFQGVSHGAAGSRRGAAARSRHRISRCAGASGKIRRDGFGRVGIWDGMVGPCVPLRSTDDGGAGRGIAVSARIRAAGGPCDL